MKIKFDIRKGVPKGNFFKKIGWYPEWFLEIDLETNKETKEPIIIQREDEIFRGFVSPFINEMLDIIKKMLCYEKLQLYDFFKKNETNKGSIRKQFDDLLKEIDELEIQKIRDEFKEYPIYEETLKRKKEIFK